ncbi:MAG: dinitrogenase iron-molybdenum cofactor biosynthesis protein [Clostridia bacterium]|nr:dinitrogenase iron-molybdenum cofactor biosynthesis protein [Clostridia bacterium]
MIIAVTYENGQIFQHFGHTEQFKVYEIEDNTIISSKVIDTNGQGHGALAGLLKTLGADILICGGIGGGAQMALANAGIQLFGGVSGSCDEAVNALLANKLNFNPQVKCNHHDHEHGEGEHTCGNHGCETHHCGGHSCH